MGREQEKRLMVQRRKHQALYPALLLALTLAACNAPAPATLPRTDGGRVASVKSPTPDRPVMPNLVPISVAPAGNFLLKGQVAVIANPKLGLVANGGGTLVANHGGSLISDHAGSLVSDVAAGVISNNTGSLISNNGSAVISNQGARFQLAQASALATFALADAEVRLTDAANTPILGKDGQPIVGKTDGAGNFSLSADLPGGNAVARISLFGGGELAALVVPSDGNTLEIKLDTASTLGAAYVLEQFVKGDQTVLNRLPKAENDRLTKELGAVYQYLVAPPRYAPAEMAGATDALQGRVPAVAESVEAVKKALSIGQANLGTGLAATQVPLALPRALSLGPDGSLYIGEGFIGRVRAVAPNGAISTFADALNGTVKTNFVRITDMLHAPDGTMYVATETAGIHRIRPGQQPEALFPAGEPFSGLLPRSLGLDAQGNLFIGTYTYPGQGKLPLLYKRSPDGTMTAIPLESALTGDGEGEIDGVAPQPDGSLLVLYAAYKGAPGTLYRLKDGQSTRLYDFTTRSGPTPWSSAALPDGTAYVARPNTDELLRISSDGKAERLGGRDATGEGSKVHSPGALHRGANGSLYVVDNQTALVYAMRPSGQFELVAGSQTVSQSGDSGSFAINQPVGVAFDSQNRLLVAESGNSRVRRYHDGTLTLVAGSGLGEAESGKLATETAIEIPTGLFSQGDHTYVSTGGGSLYDITPAGILLNLIKARKAPTPMTPGQEVDTAINRMPLAMKGITQDSQGRFYLTSASTHQVFRFTPNADGGGTLRCIAGTDRGDFPEVYNPLTYVGKDEKTPAMLFGLPSGLAFGPDGALYLADMIPCRVMRISDLDSASPRLERVMGLKVADFLAKLNAGDTNFSPENVPATDSTSYFPTAVAFDAKGNMLVAEAGTVYLAAITTAGDGNDALRNLNLPQNVGRVRLMAPDGKVRTIAGEGTAYFNRPRDGDGLLFPVSLAIAPDGRVAIGDLGANMVHLLPAGAY